MNTQNKQTTISARLSMNSQWIFHAAPKWEMQKQTKIKHKIGKKKQTSKNETTENKLNEKQKKIHTHYVQ